VKKLADIWGPEFDKYIEEQAASIATDQSNFWTPNEWLWFHDELYADEPAVYPAPMRPGSSLDDPKKGTAHARRARRARADWVPETNASRLSRKDREANREVVRVRPATDLDYDALDDNGERAVVDEAAVAKMIHDDEGAAPSDLPTSSIEDDVLALAESEAQQSVTSTEKLQQAVAQLSPEKRALYDYLLYNRDASAWEIAKAMDYASDTAARQRRFRLYASIRKLK
jgi:hypothetical protein